MRLVWLVEAGVHGAEAVPLFKENGPAGRGRAAVEPALQNVT
jgi:hypothetical protein